MKLHEYQSKQLFAQYGIPIPQGRVAATPDEARAIAAELGQRVVVKSQVLVGGRGKAGGIKLAGTPDEAYQVASQILGMDIKGLPVRHVLVDEASDIQQEIYLGVVIDRAARRVTLMASAAGGVEIEEVARKTPEKLTKLQVDPFIGLRDYQARQIAYFLKLPADLVRDFTTILRGLYECFIACDASLAEINPLVITSQGKLLALDGKIVLDDSGLFRHGELAAMRSVDEEVEAESEARQNGLSYIKLDGEIGCMVNGAGLAMTTMDLVQLFGSQPANFLDIGGGATADRVAAALRILLSDSNVKAVLFNVFGGITRCDEVAKGVVTALDQVPTELPMVIRLVGTNEDEGRAILAEAGLPNLQTASTLVEAARKAVAAAQGQPYTPLPQPDPILYTPRAKTSSKPVTSRKRRATSTKRRVTRDGEKP